MDVKGYIYVSKAAIPIRKAFSIPVSKIRAAMANRVTSIKFSIKS